MDYLNLGDRTENLNTSTLVTWSGCKRAGRSNAGIFLAGGWASDRE
jgi:hypothetical protein